VPVSPVPAPENAVAVAVPETDKDDKPLIEPPVMLTLLAFWVDMVPREPVALLTAVVTKAVVAS